MQAKRFANICLPIKPVSCASLPFYRIAVAASNLPTLPSSFINSIYHRQQRPSLFLPFPSFFLSLPIAALFGKKTPGNYRLFLFLSSTAPFRRFLEPVATRAHLASAHAMWNCESNKYVFFPPWTQAIGREKSSQRREICGIIIMVVWIGNFF